MLSTLLMPEYPAFLTLTPRIKFQFAFSRILAESVRLVAN